MYVWVLLSKHRLKGILKQRVNKPPLHIADDSLKEFKLVHVLWGKRHCVQRSEIYAC